MLSACKTFSVVMKNCRNYRKFDPERFIVESQGKKGIGCHNRNHPLGHVSAKSILPELLEKVQFRDPSLESVENYSKLHTGSLKTGLREIQTLFDIVDYIVYRSYERIQRFKKTFDFNNYTRESAKLVLSLDISDAFKNALMGTWSRGVLIRGSVKPVTRFKLVLNNTPNQLGVFKLGYLTGYPLSSKEAGIFDDRLETSREIVERKAFLSFCRQNQNYSQLYDHPLSGIDANQQLDQGKLLLMLQSVKRGFAIDRNNPKMHECFVQFLELVSKYKNELPEVMQQVLQQEINQMFNGQDASTLNSEFLGRNGNSLSHVLAAAKMTCHLDLSQQKQSLALVTKFSPDDSSCSLAACEAVLESMHIGDFGSCEAETEDYQAFTHAKAFASTVPNGIADKSSENVVVVAAAASQEISSNGL